MTKTSLFIRTLMYGLLLSVVACGADHDDQRTQREFEQAPRFQPEKPYVLRGTWEMKVSTTDGHAMMLASKASATVNSSVTVAPRVRFTVDSDAFGAPADAEDGVLSFGSLEVSTLRDNQLRVCGAGGNDRCTLGVIRIFTQGKPGSGMWNDTEEYGIPVSSNGSAVGLDAANALDLATASINNLRVLRLNHFTGGGSLNVPIDVDFSEAAAGDYETTFVVEYILQ